MAETSDQAKLPPYSDLPPYTDEEPTNVSGAPNTNPYHAGYNQPMFGPSGGMAMQPPVQGVSTNTVILQQQPVMTVVAPPRGSDLTVPAVLVTIFCCVCTGIPAIVYAMRAQREYGLGKWQEGESSQRKARGWIIGTIVTHVAIWVLCIVLYFTVIAVMVNKAQNDLNGLN